MNRIARSPQSCGIHRIRGIARPPRGRAVWLGCAPLALALPTDKRGYWLSLSNYLPVRNMQTQIAAVTEKVAGGGY